MNGCERMEDGIFDRISDPTAAGKAPPLFVSAAPHRRGKESVPRIMLWTLLALVPAVCITPVLFGIRGCITIVLSAAAAAATQWILSFTIQKRISLPDCSACITGALLALSLPARLPFWVAPAGSVFAIALVKVAFGGLGRNFLNPALAGRAFVALSFPALFTIQAGPASSLPFAQTLDVPDILLNLLFGYQNGWMGSSAAALLIGAIMVWRLRIIDAILPLSFIGSAYLLFWCAGGSDPFFTSDAPLTALSLILSGGVVLGALFMATDPVTSPATPRLRLLFGTGCGILTFSFWRLGDTHSGVMSAILIMNLAVPYLDRHLMHKPFGAPKKREKSPETHPAESSDEDRNFAAAGLTANASPTERLKGDG